MYYILIYGRKLRVHKVLKLIKVSRCTTQVFYVILIGPCFAKIILIFPKIKLSALLRNINKINLFLSKSLNRYLYIYRNIQYYVLKFKEIS